MAEPENCPKSRQAMETATVENEYAKPSIAWRKSHKDAEVVQ